MALNDKQQRFVAEYLKDQNATQAAIRAGYSQKTAGSQGFDLLKKPEIADEIRRKTGKILEKAEFTAERVIQELARIVTFDPRKLYSEDGSLKPITELDDDTAMALSGFEVTEEFDGNGKERSAVGFTKKVKWLDKNTAITNALRMFGKLTDKVEHTGKDGGPIETKELSETELARRVAFLLTSAANKKD